MRAIKRRSLTKRASNHLHAKRRAAERYGLNLTQDVHRAIVKIIQERGGKLQAQRQSNSRTIFTLPYDGNWLKVVYDKVHHNLVTILPILELPDA
jgi:hypothetical protein